MKIVFVLLVLVVCDAQESTVRINGSDPVEFITQRVFGPIPGHDTRWTVRGPAVVVDAYWYLLTGANKTVVPDECDATTFWHTSPEETKEKGLIAVASLFTVFVCGGMRQSSQFLCNYEKAGFKSVVFWFDAMVAPFGSFGWGPDGYPDCTPDIPLYGTQSAPAKYNGNALLDAGVTAVQNPDLNHTFRLELVESKNADFIIGMNEPWMYAFFYIGCFFSCILVLYTFWAIYQLRERMLSIAGLALFMEGIAAGFMRAWKNALEPLFYRRTVNWHLNGIIYYLDLQFSMFANVLIVCVFARLVFFGPFNEVQAAIFKIASLAIALLMTLPIMNAMTEWAFLFHNQDIGYVTSGTIGEDVADLNTRLRTSYFHYVLAILIAFVLVSAALQYKLGAIIKIGAPDSAIMKRAMSMRLEIIVQVLLYIPMAVACYFDYLVAEDLLIDEVRPCQFTFAVKCFAGFFLGIVQVYSMYKLLSTGDEKRKRKKYYVSVKNAASTPSESTPGGPTTAIVDLSCNFAYFVNTEKFRWFIDNFPDLMLFPWEQLRAMGVVEYKDPSNIEYTFFSHQWETPGHPFPDLLQLSENISSCTTPWMWVDWYCVPQWARNTNPFPADPKAITLFLISMKAFHKVCAKAADSMIIVKRHEGLKMRGYDKANGWQIDTDLRDTACRAEEELADMRKVTTQKMIGKRPTLQLKVLVDELSNAGVDLEYAIRAWCALERCFLPASSKHKDVRLIRLQKSLEKLHKHANDLARESDKLVDEYKRRRVNSIKVSPGLSEQEPGDALSLLLSDIERLEGLLQLCLPTDENRGIYMNAWSYEYLKKNILTISSAADYQYLDKLFVQDMSIETQGTLYMQSIADHKEMTTKAETSTHTHNTQHPPAHQPPATSQPSGWLHEPRLYFPQGQKVKPLSIKEVVGYGREVNAIVETFDGQRIGQLKSIDEDSKCATILISDAGFLGATPSVGTFKLMWKGSSESMTAVDVKTNEYGPWGMADRVAHAKRRKMVRMSQSMGQI